MPKTLSAVSSLTYLQLLALVRSQIAEGKKIIAQTQTEKYWNIGKAISEYVLNGKDRASYGEYIFEELAKDLNIDKRTLERTVQFYRKFPIAALRPQLSWTHYRELLTLPDPEERKRLLTKAREENLTSRELKEEIRKKKLVIPTEGPVPQLKFTRGKLYTYKIIEFRPEKSNEEVKHIDCGFHVSYGPRALQLAQFEAGQIVKTGKVDKSYSVRSSDRAVSDLYTFKAGVVKILDGDTLIGSMDLGFRVWKEQKLRFRGIDCPEIDTPAGQKAKKFVEDRIKQCKLIVVKTYKDDKYGRYLVDVFYQIGESDPVQVAAQGIFLNQELLDNRLAVKW